MNTIEPGTIGFAFHPVVNEIIPCRVVQVLDVRLTKVSKINNPKDTWFTMSFSTNILHARTLHEERFE
jgi:hypothetical protein